MKKLKVEIKSENDKIVIYERANELVEELDQIANGKSEEISEIKGISNEEIKIMVINGYNENIKELFWNKSLNTKQTNKLCAIYKKLIKLDIFKNCDKDYMIIDQSENINKDYLLDNLNFTLELLELLKASKYNNDALKKLNRYYQLAEQIEKEFNN